MIWRPKLGERVKVRFYREEATIVRVVHAPVRKSVTVRFDDGVQMAMERGNLFRVKANA